MKKVTNAFLRHCETSLIKLLGDNISLLLAFGIIDVSQVSEMLGCK